MHLSLSVLLAQLMVIEDNKRGRACGLGCGVLNMCTQCRADRTPGWEKVTALQNHNSVLDALETLGNGV